MRTLNINKVDIWYVLPEQEIEVKDDNGHFTGETEITFGTPIKTKLQLYPANSKIIERMFGKDASFDMVSVSNDLELSKDTMLFTEEPNGNYENTYDYKVSSIAKSLNTYGYGLKGRV